MNSHGLVSHIARLALACALGFPTLSTALAVPIAEQALLETSATHEGAAFIAAASGSTTTQAVLFDLDTALVPRFDPALGDLQRVRIEVTGATSNLLFASMDSLPTDACGFLTTDLPCVFTSAYAFLHSQQLMFDDSLGLQRNLFVPNLFASCIPGGIACLTASLPRELEFEFSAELVGAAAAPYIGTDDFVVQMRQNSAQLQLTLGPTPWEGRVGATFSTSLSASATLRYLYDFTPIQGGGGGTDDSPSAVPAPGMLWLMGLGLGIAGLAVTRRGPSAPIRSHWCSPAPHRARPDAESTRPPGSPR
jgi:hypothetical protein